MEPSAIGRAESITCTLPPPAHPLALPVHSPRHTPNKTDSRYSHDGADASAVALPHASEAGLPAKIPEFDGHIPLVDLTHVEADRRDGVFGELPHLVIAAPVFTPSSPPAPTPPSLCAPGCAAGRLELRSGPGKRCSYAWRGREGTGAPKLTAMTLTSVVLPAPWRPSIVSSISFDQNMLPTKKGAVSDFMLTLGAPAVLAAHLRIHSMKSSTIFAT